MTDHKQPESQTATAGSLLSQWWTMGAIALDKRTAGRHMTVAWVLIDRHMKKSGNARASLSYIEAATNLSRPTVIGACRELVKWGYFTRHPGIGTRPSEYSPNWLVVKKGLLQASGKDGFTPSGKDGLTSSAPSGKDGFTQNLLTSPADKPADSIVGNEDTPDPLPALGLTASAAVSRDPEGFEDFWKSYPRKHQRTKAEAAWTKLNPDAELTAAIIEGAQRLAGHYAEHPIDKKWMKLPANWLAGKGWTEDLPEIYADAKQAAIAKKASQPKPKAANSNEPTLPTVEPKPSKEPFKPWRRQAEVVTAYTRLCDGEQWLELEFNFDDGETYEDSIWLDGKGDNPSEEEYAHRQQQRAWDLYSAAGLPHYAEPEDLVGTTIELAQFNQYSDASYYPINRPNREPRFPAGGFRATVEKHPLDKVHPNSFAAAFAKDEYPVEEDDFDMTDFIARAKRITGEAA